MLEILIALAIGAIIFGSMFAVYDRTLWVEQQSREQGELEQSARMIIFQLHQDLMGLYYQFSGEDYDPGPYSFRGGAEGAEVTEGHEEQPAVLRLGTTSSLDFGDAEFPRKKLFQVGYMLQESGTSGGKTLLLRQQQPFPQIREDTESLSLADNVSGFVLTFTDCEGTEFTSWNSAERRKDDLYPLPQRVSLELEVRSDAGKERSYRRQFVLGGNKDQAEQENESAR